MAYDLLVFVHLMLFIIWLGGGIGGFVLGQQSGAPKPIAPTNA